MKTGKRFNIQACWRKRFLI